VTCNGAVRRAEISERHSKAPRWSAGPLRCRTKACHITRGLVSALTWFGSVLEAAVVGAPDDASCLLALGVPCLRVCADVSDLLSCSLSRVHLYRLYSSSEQGTYVSDEHNTRTNYFTYLEQENVILLLWKLTQPQHRNTQREQKKHRPRQTDRQTDRNTHTHTHTHTPGRQECDMLGTSWWFS
jgi:hypothetical protein